MENNKNFAITKLTAVFMAVIMVLSAGITPVLAAEEGDVGYVAAIGDTLYESLQAAVDAAEGETIITLNADANGDGIFVTGDKNITLDFGGHTYTVDGELVGSSGTKSQAMHLEKGAKVTLKNGTLKAGGEVRMLVQNYCDLTLDSFSLDTNGKKIYALSNNCGDTLITGESNITSGAAAFDLWYNLQGGYHEGVTVTFDENFTGTVIGNIEYGAYGYAENWTEKTALVIKGGTFEGEFVSSTTAFESDLDDANITLYGGVFADEKAASFCAECYTAVAENGKYKIVPIVSDDKGNTFATLQQAVNAAEGETIITLNTDANGDGIFVTGDKNITLDFGGHTYTVDGELVGSSGTKSQAMHLEKGAAVTLRNGTLKAGGEVRMLVQNYCDLTLDSFSLDTNGKKIYALSNNCGDTLITGESNITSGAAAFDLWYNLQGGYHEGVTVTFDENFTGTVIGNIEYGAYGYAENWTEKTALVIKGGTFEGEFVSSTTAFESDLDDANITLYGGVFADEKAASFCAEHYKAVEEGEKYKVVHKNYIVSSTDGKEYETLQEAVNAAEGQTTLTLKTNANGDGIFVTGDKNITFDFGGHTYTVDGELVGSSGTKSQAMHLEKGAAVTLRNGTLKAGGEVRMLVQNYCDLTLDSFSLDTNGKKIYALSNNCGDTLITGESNITSGAAAFDLWYNLQGGYPEGVTATFDENYTGTVIGDIEYGADRETDNWTEKTVLIIKGGTFKGKIKNLEESTLYAGDMNITLYGGSFVNPVNLWCAEGSEHVTFEDGTYGPCFHDFTEKITDKAHFCAKADCERGNVYYYDCSKCAKIGEATFDDGEKTGHSFSSYIYNDDATCIKDGTATAFCDRENCNGTDTIVFEGSAKHGWSEWTVTKNATCTVKGEEERICVVCGETEKRAFEAGHTYSNIFVTDVQPQCGKTGSKSRHCIYCDAKTDITPIPAKVHVNKVTVTPSSLKGPGYITTTCTLCGKSSSVKIYRIKTVKLSKTAYTYTGKAFKPEVTVKDYKGKVLVKGKDYTVKYTNNKAIGKGKAIITFKGNYSGTKTLTFSISPAKVSSLKLTAKNDAMALSWKTVKGADGYQIISSTSKNFKKNKKTLYIKKQSTKKTTLKKLKSGKKYYVKIRAYKKVNGKNVFGAYSSIKNAKVK